MQRIITHQPRSGLSIIEVLTSMVVAMIGVVGVMMLIPFAVKQAKVGMDSDAAVQLARNAYSEFEIRGYRIPENWWDPARNRQYLPDITKDFGNGPVGLDGPKTLAIDPLGVLTNSNLFANGPGYFPLNAECGDDENDLELNLEDLIVEGFPAIEIFSLAKPVFAYNPNNPNPRVLSGIDQITRGLAEKFFRSGDDLVFGAPTDDLGPPQQVFNQGINGNLTRQSKGRISWSAIVVPSINQTVANQPPESGWSYKLYILVYKIRKTLATDQEGKMVVAKVAPGPVGLQSPVTNVTIPFLKGLPDDTPTAQRDDWVMLINKDPNGVPGFENQIGFYRIIDVTVAGEVDSLPPTFLTLDGPDFNFFGDNSAVPPTAATDTYIVHLKDVIGVFEHTFTPETESNWTVNF